MLLMLQRLKKVPQRRRESQSSFSTLSLYNSLSKSKEPLVPKESTLTWYSCGPTVYDHAHVGHARTYVNQDILYRILTQYYQMPVNYVMGMTDVDDKIIAAANAQKVSALEISKHFEREFMKDMRALNVLQPSAMVRVSDYIPEIISYIETIKNNGFAYESVDGIYFDVEAFNNASSTGSTYGKLSSDSSTTTSAQKHDIKRDARDFALWKAAKDRNEIQWESPWNIPGRPGWHIECSTMSYEMFGKSFDLHSGGVDLRFPHHTNELAQCEAYAAPCCDRKNSSCDHYIHFGQLNIKGLKMSKSLKNYVSIKEFLAHNSSNVFRIFCLQHQYRSNVHYSNDRMVEASAIWNKIESFLTLFEDKVEPQRRWKDAEFNLFRRFQQCQAAVDNALGDDLDTPTVLTELLNLISESNSYRNSLVPSTSTLSSTPLYSVYLYIKKILNLFGITTESSTLDNGVPSEALSTMVEFRHHVRQEALKTKPIDESSKKILELCDSSRNEMLQHSNIQIVDKKDGDSAWRFKTKSTTAKTASDTSSTAAVSLSTIEPSELFKVGPAYKGCFSQYDSEGIPTHDNEGQDLSIRKRKKLEKKFKQHQLRFKENLVS